MRLLALGVVGLVVAAGCGATPERAPKLALSWGATAQRTGEAWLAREIPAAYAERTVAAAGRALHEQRTALREHPASVPNAAKLGALLEELTRSVSRLERALARDDRDDVRRALADVARLSSAIRPWTPEAGS